MTPTPRTPQTPQTRGASRPRLAPAVPGPSAAPKVGEAVAARDALAAALSQAGIQLPAMDVRTPWADEREAEARYALVHLGVCSAPVALMLADVILKGVAR